MYCMKIAEGLARELATGPSGKVDDEAHIVMLEMCRDIFDAAVARAISPEEAVQLWMGAFNLMTQDSVTGDRIMEIYNEECGGNDIIFMETILQNVTVIAPPFVPPPPQALGALPPGLENLPPELRDLLMKAAGKAQTMTKKEFEQMIKNLESAGKNVQVRAIPY